MITTIFFVAPNVIPQKSRISDSSINLSNLTSDTSRISVVGSWPWGSCYAAAAKDNYAYIGNGYMFQVLDISDSTNPHVIGSVNSIGSLKKIYLFDGYAIASPTYQVYDISNPKSPKLLFYKKFGQVSTTFYIKGNYAYSGDFSGAIYIIDISDPLNPVLISSIYADGEQVTSIAVSGDYLYATTTDSPNMSIFDISNKTSPKLVNTFSKNVVGGSLTSYKNYLYLGISHQLIVYDAYAGSVLFQKAIVKLQSTPGSSFVKDTLLYLPLGGGFAICSIKNPANPLLLSSIKDPFTPQYPYTLYVDGDHAYLSNIVGLWVVNTTNAYSPLTTSLFETAGITRKVRISGDNAYLLSQNSGLIVLDVSNLSDPVYKGRLPIYDKQLYDLAVQNETAFILTSDDLKIINVSNPKNPVLLTTYLFSDNLLPTSLAKIAVSDSLLAVTRSNGIILLLNIKNVTSPSIMDSIKIDYFPNDISLSGATLFISDYAKGVLVYDIATDPPTKTNNLDKYPVALSTLENSDDLYVVDGDNTVGLSVYNISKITGVQFINRINIPGGVLYVNTTFNNNTVYVSYNDNLISINVSDPNNLYSSIYQGYYTFEGVAAKNGYIYSAVGEKGILVLRDSLVTGVIGNSNIDVPNKLILYQNYPNPFNPLTQVKFYLPYSTYIKLILYNSLGQVVRVIRDGYLTGGYHTISINASELSSGVYYYLLKTPLGTITKKMILIK